MELVGAFQIARCTYQSDIFLWKPARWFKVWVYLLGSVNHTDSKQFTRGQGRFTYEKIYHECNLGLEGIQKNAIKNVISRMKKQGNLTTQKTTRGFIVNIVKYNDYQTLDNYKNHTQKKKQRTHKEHTNHTIIEEGKNERINNWTKDLEEYVWDNYPHARKGKKQDTLKNFSSYAPEIVIGMVKIYKREVAVGMQEAKFVPASERRSRDFVSYSETMQDQKLKSIYYKLLDERDVDKIKIFTEDFGQEKIMEMYNQRKDENRQKTLSALMK